MAASRRSGFIRGDGALVEDMQPAVLFSALLDLLTCFFLRSLGVFVSLFLCFGIVSFLNPRVSARMIYRHTILCHLAPSVSPQWLFYV